MQIDGQKNGSSERLYFCASKITADGDCSHEIKRHLLLGRKAMTNLKVKVKLLSHAQLFATPCIVAYQAPLSMEFSRQEYWSGLPFLSPGDLPNPGIEPRSPALQADALPSESPEKPNLDGILKSRNITLPTKIHLIKAMVFPVVMHVWMWKLDHKESWAPKNWCFWTVVLEKTLESPLDCKEIQLVHPSGNQSWIFIRRTDAEAATPILWPPDVKNWLIGKDPGAGKDWRQEEKGTTEDEMVGWHHRLNVHEFE